ncbi:hypothetical protein L202_00080 [Cryptococcus amylolentus CBS 6039]|uniref:N-acetyltransferase domain-containing protein n=1 Tax=Cryptococcus amylolentus CBS 6039 TaxID=1295533 RepID=A0A1E3I894_9TREE|nr:hypothetical protein L202_00080 [Cryptococcus amylolentus CBS 6039]ODN84056.1 hypothetical protein L202_00080 [Cryptococcus amylolentus CBS 6039]
MPSNFTIRPALPSDAPGVSALAISSWHDVYANSVSELATEAATTTTFSEDSMRKDLESPNHITLIAEGGPSGKDVVGLSVLKSGVSTPGVSMPSAIKLGRFYVHSSLHGSGLAQRLLEETEQTVKDTGEHEGSWLHVWSENGRAVRFWEKEGFKRVGEESWVVGDSQLELITMEKAL